MPNDYIQSKYQRKKAKKAKLFTKGKSRSPGSTQSNPKDYSSTITPEQIPSTESPVVCVPPSAATPVPKQVTQVTSTSTIPIPKQAPPVTSTSTTPIPK